MYITHCVCVHLTQASIKVPIDHAKRGEDLFPRIADYSPRWSPAIWSENRLINLIPLTFFLPQAVWKREYSCLHFISLHVSIKYIHVHTTCICNTDSDIYNKAFIRTFVSRTLHTDRRITTPTITCKHVLLYELKLTLHWSLNALKNDLGTMRCIHQSLVAQLWNLKIRLTDKGSTRA